ncbi:Alanine--glyoxylate aminotransferase 2, mitochondrial, variant 2 [Trifolium repens]|nr:Alanine--glyoxylate aminotransferase 2, mitochondrial, variant 2 [Trifolium repens]
MAATAAALQSLLKRATKLNTFDLLTLCRDFCSKQIIRQPQLPPFDHQPRPYNGPTIEEMLAGQKSFLGPSINLIITLFSYSVSCGHCHPDVLKAIFEQTQLLTGLLPCYLHHTLGDFMEALASKMLGNLKVVLLVDSGFEARKMAIQMARMYTDNVGMIGLSTLDSWKYPDLEGEIHHVMNPDPYRGFFGADANSYAKDVQDYIAYGTSGKVAGFIAETIQGVEGVVELAPAPGYLRDVYDIVHKDGGVCIADEVQTGFGRTGSHYWGFETQGVIPDIVTIVMGTGYCFPLGAVVTIHEIANVVAPKIQIKTFAGSPACFACGIAVLKVLDKEKRQAHCADVGSHLLERLKSLKKKHDIIGDVRGRGLMLGVELVTDRKNKTPAKAETAVLFEKLRELGILVGKGGLHGNVFQINPQVCLSKDDADFLVDALD